MNNNNQEYHLLENSNEKEKDQKTQKFVEKACIYLAIQYFIIRVIVKMFYLQNLNITIEYNFILYIASWIILAIILYFIDQKCLKEDINNIKDHETFYNCISVIIFVLTNIYWILLSTFRKESEINAILGNIFLNFCFMIPLLNYMGIPMSLVLVILNLLIFSNNYEPIMWACLFITYSVIFFHYIINKNNFTLSFMLFSYSIAIFLACLYLFAILISIFILILIIIFFLKRSKDN